MAKPKAKAKATKVEEEEELNEESATQFLLDEEAKNLAQYRQPDDEETLEFTQAFAMRELIENGVGLDAKEKIAFLSLMRGTALGRMKMKNDAKSNENNESLVAAVLLALGNTNIHHRDNATRKTAVPTLPEKVGKNYAFKDAEKSRGQDTVTYEEVMATKIVD